MKIALTGTHGTGKTTLAEKIGKELDIPVIKNITRNILKEAGYKNIDEYLNEKLENKLQLQEYILEKYKEIEDSYDNFIHDRAIYDVMAYSMYFRRFDGNEDFEDIVSMNFMFELLEEHQRYDFLIYLPIKFKVSDTDKFRNMSYQFQHGIDLFIKHMLMDGYVPKYIIPTSDNIEERVNMVIKYVRENNIR